MRKFSTLRRLFFWISVLVGERYLRRIRPPATPQERSDFPRGGVRPPQERSDLPAGLGGGGGRGLKCTPPPGSNLRLIQLLHSQDGLAVVARSDLLSDEPHLAHGHLSHDMPLARCATALLRMVRSEAIAIAVSMSTEQAACAAIATVMMTDQPRAHPAARIAAHGLDARHEAPKSSIPAFYGQLSGGLPVCLSGYL